MTIQSILSAFCSKDIFKPPRVTSAAHRVAGWIVRSTSVPNHVMSMYVRVAEQATCFGMGMCRGKVEVPVLPETSCFFSPGTSRENLHGEHIREHVDEPHQRSVF